MVYGESDVKAVTDHLTNDPHANSVGEIARATGLPDVVVVEILDREQPDEGWLPKEIAEQYRETRTESIFIGNRWPDGSLREEPFDINNDDHLREMGLEKHVNG